MTSPQAGTDTVYFEGPWGPQQRVLLSEAIEEFEASRTDSRLFNQAPEWVCVAYDVGQSQLFCAHRPYLPSVLTGQTARQLASDIRNSA